MKGSIYSKISCPIEPNHNKEWLAVKFPGNTFNIGSIMEVPPGTICIAVHGGKIVHIFENGSVVLSTENFPFISGQVRRLFGGKNPFNMDFYYINRTSVHKFLWGAGPITAKSPYKEDGDVTFKFGARGEFFLRVKHYQFFYEWILGSLAYGEFVYWNFLEEKVKSFFNGMATSFLNKYVNKHGVAIHDVQSLGDICNSDIKVALTQELEQRFGLEIQTMTTIIAVDPKDLDAYNEARKERQRALMQGTLDDISYARGVQQRQLDIMKDGANNQGSVGQMMGAGFGLGAGMMMMGQAPNVINGNTNPTISGNNVQRGDAKETKKCPKCKSQVLADNKFCPECGFSLLDIVCPKCKTKITSGTNFCPECGTKIGE